MKSMHLADAVVAVAKATSPEKWSRYCELASKIRVCIGTEAEGEAAGRARLTGHVREDVDALIRGEHRDINPELYALENAFLDLFVEAMRSKQISVSCFDPDYLSGPIRITPEMMDIVLDVMRARVVDPDLVDAKIDWDASAIQFGNRTLIGIRAALKEAPVESTGNDEARARRSPRRIPEERLKNWMSEWLKTARNPDTRSAEEAAKQEFGDAVTREAVRVCFRKLRPGQTKPGPKGPRKHPITR